MKRRTLYLSLFLTLVVVLMMMMIRVTTYTPQAHELPPLAQEHSVYPVATSSYNFVRPPAASLVVAHLVAPRGTPTPAADPISTTRVPPTVLVAIIGCIGVIGAAIVTGVFALLAARKR